MLYLDSGFHHGLVGDVDRQHHFLHSAPNRTMKRLLLAYCSVVALPSSLLAFVSQKIDPRWSSVASSRPVDRTPSFHRSIGTSSLLMANGNDDLPDFELPEEQAERMKEQAEKLRQQIRDMEKEIAGRRPAAAPPPSTAVVMEPTTGPSLRNRRIMVVGANGRLGSMVCRYLLRNYPEVKEVVACVHYVGESSTRGYGRLSYEVGAEDGKGSIGAFWNGEERVASFVYDGEVMSGYNLSKLRIVEAELLDPVQCQTICEGVDSVIYCATDFDGNKPRALGIDFAFLFRAVASPTKGRAEIEGLENILGGLKLAKLENEKDSSRNSKNDPTNFVLVSMVPEAFDNFETPYGEFNGLKRQAESKLGDYPSLSYTVLQMGRFEDNFVEEDLPLTIASEPTIEAGKRRLVNRRDAAKAVVDSLLQDDIAGKVMQVYSAVR